MFLESASTATQPLEAALVVGNPRFSEPELRLPDLPEAEAEAREVAALYPPSVAPNGRGRYQGRLSWLENPEPRPRDPISRAMRSRTSRSPACPGCSSRNAPRGPPEASSRTKSAIETSRSVRIVGARWVPNQQRTDSSRRGRHQSRAPVSCGRRPDRAGDPLGLELIARAVHCSWSSIVACGAGLRLSMPCGRRNFD